MFKHHLIVVPNTKHTYTFNELFELTPNYYILIIKIAISQPNETESLQIIITLILNNITYCICILLVAMCMLKVKYIMFDETILSKLSKQPHTSIKLNPSVCFSSVYDKNLVLE